MFQYIGNQIKRGEAVNDMFGGALERSMRMLFGDPDGDAVRQSLPNFQDRYSHHRQRDIDRAGGMQQAIARLRQQGGYGGTSDYLRGLVPGSQPKTDDELAKLLEDRWRNAADTDMRNYDMAQERQMRESNYGFKRPTWMSY